MARIGEQGMPLGFPVLCVINSELEQAGGRGRAGGREREGERERERDGDGEGERERGREIRKRWQKD